MPGYDFIVSIDLIILHYYCNYYNNYHSIIGELTEKGYKKRRIKLELDILEIELAEGIT